MTHIRRFACLPMAAGATPAHAHSPVPGIEGFYTGLLHPFATPSQALLIAGLALLAGGASLEKARWFLGVFLIASLLGLILGPRVAEVDLVLFAMGIAICSVAALAPGKLMLVTVALAGIGGYLIGEASIPDDGPTRDRVVTMSGSIFGANLGLLYLFGITHVLRERYSYHWLDIAFRVVAAWLGAVALLMFTLGFVEVPTPP